MALAQNNISISEVKTVLNEAYYELSVLCQSSNINKYSLRKPVILPASQSVNNDYWYRGADGMCGFSIPYLSFGSIASLQTKTNVTGVTSMDWIYLKPSGGTDSPFRLGDFRLYAHDSEPCISPATSYKLDTFYNAGSSYTFGVSLDGGDGALNVQLSEMTGFTWSANKMVVVLFNKNTSTHVKTIIASDPMSLSSGGDLVDDLSALSNVNYDAYFLFYNSDLGRYYPIQKSSTVNPVEFSKFYGDYLDFISNQMSYKYNGTYQDWEDIDFDTLGSSALTLITLGYFAVKTTLTNSSNSNITVQKTEFTIDGSSVYSENFIGANVVMRSGTTQITSVTIPSNGAVTVTFESVDPILFYDGDTFTNPTTNQLHYCEFAVVHNGSLTQSLFGGQIKVKYTGSEGWE